MTEVKSTSVNPRSMFTMLILLCIACTTTAFNKNHDIDMDAVITSPIVSRQRNRRAQVEKSTKAPKKPTKSSKASKASTKPEIPEAPEVPEVPEAPEGQTRTADEIGKGMGPLVADGGLPNGSISSGLTNTTMANTTSSASIVGVVDPYSGLIGTVLAVVGMLLFK